MRAIWLSAARRPAAAKFTETITAAVPSPPAKTMTADRSRKRRTTRRECPARWKKLQPMFRLGAQRADRINAGGPPRGIQPESQSDAGREAERVQEDPPIIDQRRPCPPSTCSNGDETDQRAQRAASQTNEDRFDRELPEHVKAAGPNATADADLLPSLGNADQHQAHDHDSAK